MKAKSYLWIAGIVATVSLVFAAEKPPAKPVEITSSGWISLFNGKTLGKWKPSDFPDNDKIEVKDGVLKIGVGKPMAGITWDGEPPARMNYEIELEAMRTAGNDFFCGLTFPVGKDPCSLICGGWGGMVVGLSCIDGYDAAENQTSTGKEFKDKTWYKIKIRVTKERIEAWINDEKVVTQDLEGHKISIRGEIEPAVPLGISTWYTGSGLRNIRWRSLD